MRALCLPLTVHLVGGQLPAIGHRVQRGWCWAGDLEQLARDWSGFCWLQRRQQPSHSAEPFADPSSAAAGAQCTAAAGRQSICSHEAATGA